MIVQPSNTLYFITAAKCHFMTHFKMTQFKIRPWLNFKVMNGNDLDQWVIYIQTKIMLGKDLVKLVIFMKIRTIIGNDQVRIDFWSNHSKYSQINMNRNLFRNYIIKFLYSLYKKLSFDTQELI